LRKAGGRSYTALSPTIMANTKMASFRLASRAHTLENDHQMRHSLGTANWTSAHKVLPRGLRQIRGPTTHARLPRRAFLSRHPPTYPACQRAILDHPDWDIGIHPFHRPQILFRSPVRRPLKAALRYAGIRSMKTQAQRSMLPLIGMHKRLARKTPPVLPSPRSRPPYTVINDGPGRQSLHSHETTKNLDRIDTTN